MTKAPPTVRDESAAWAGGREMDGGMREGGGGKEVWREGLRGVSSSSSMRGPRTSLYITSLPLLYKTGRLGHFFQVSSQRILSE